MKIAFLAGLWMINVWASPQKLTQKTHLICGRKVALEMAVTPEERRIGLMERDGLAPGKGMAFVFEKPQQLTFWMKNVPFDIDIGFFDAHGKLLSFETMKGESPLVREDALARYSSSGLSRYAVELPKGFFRAGDHKSCQLSPLP